MRCGWKALAWVGPFVIALGMAAAAEEKPAAPEAPADAPAASSPGTASKAAGEQAAPPSPAKPSRLALVGRTRENVIYIDKPTLRKLSSDKFELWAEVRGDGGDRVKFLLQLNCGERSYFVKSKVVYGPGGEVIENATPRSPTLQYVVPDSASEFIHDAICRRP